MKKVITYGTFDMLHYGHINLLKRAKELGDYLIVGVTTENFDMTRGKLNITESLMDRMQAVIDTGYADEVIAEEYEGQKIDDIIKYDIDIFTVGSDWEGYFDYLREYCDVIYLERTKGISSTQIRKERQYIKLGIIGWDSVLMKKIAEESKYVSGMHLEGVLLDDESEQFSSEIDKVMPCLSEKIFFESVDAVYIYASPVRRYTYIKKAILQQKHVLCATPIALREQEAKELYQLAKENGVILYDAIKTASFPAFNRLVLLAKSGIVGEIKSVDVTCTSLVQNNRWDRDRKAYGGSMTSWGPFALLAVFSLLGIKYQHVDYVSYMDLEKGFDLFTKMNLVYDNALADIKVGIGVKAEGDLIISGTKGYIYVPSPWWKTDYFEVRYENFTNNRRYFYQLPGEGLRYVFADFMKYITCVKNPHLKVSPELSQAICNIMEDFYKGDNTTIIG